MSGKNDFSKSDTLITLNLKNSDDKKGKKWGYRHQQCFIMLWVLSVAYTMRSSMGVSLVAMVSHSDVKYDSTLQNNSEEFKTKGFFNSLILIPPYPLFCWSKKTQDIIIASFFWGYMILQIPAGQLAYRFGAKHMLIGAMTINCVASILLPTLTYYGGWYCTVTCRIIQGLSQACIVPSLHTAIGKWAPLQERGQLSAFVYGGQALGTVFGLPLTGFISASRLGWPGIFRFYGVLSGITAILIWIFIFNSPAQHPKITNAERWYIEEDLGTENDGKKKMPIPWLKILRHRGVFAIIIAHFGQTWGQTILYSEVPAYMDKIMGVNIKANGVLTALPFFVMWLTNFFFSWLNDWLIVNKVLSVTNARKFANSLGSIPAGLGLIALAYVPNNIYYVETILVLICAFKVSSNCGFMINHIDISPNFAGTMMSISNFISNIGSSIAPIVVAFILTNVSDQYLWRQVFFLSAGLYLITNIVYVIIGTSDRAKWNSAIQEYQTGEESIPMVEKAKKNNESLKS